MSKGKRGGALKTCRKFGLLKRGNGNKFAKLLVMSTPVRREDEPVVFLPIPWRELAWARDEDVGAIRASEILDSVPIVF